jgi:hypothetical protein
MRFRSCLSGLGVVLLLASSSSAATQMDLVARGIGPVVEWSEIAGQSFLVDILITTDQPGVSAVQMALDGDAGFSYPAGDIYPFSQNPEYAPGWTDDDQFLVPGTLPTPNFGAIAEVPPIVPPGLFATVTLECNVPEGEYLISPIDVAIADANFTQIPDVVVNPLVITPEPASALLLGLGLVMLLRSRKM